MLELGSGGEHLSPAEYHEKMGQSDTVIVDVRNAYEAAIGRCNSPVQSLFNRRFNPYLIAWK